MKKTIRFSALVIISLFLLVLSAKAQTQRLELPDSLKSAWYKDFELITEDEGLLQCINRKAKECEQSFWCAVVCTIALPACVDKWTAECILQK